MSGIFLREDLRALFDCGEFAESAIYVPAAGRPKPVAVILDRPIEDVGLGRGGAVAEGLTAYLQVCDWPDPPARPDQIRIRLNGTLTPFAVKKARRDESGDVWLVELAEQ